MGCLSDYLSNALLEHTLMRTAYTRPTMKLALLTAAPDKDTTVATMTEATVTGYARQACNSWEIANSRATSNSAVITFPEITAGSELINYWAVIDEAAGKIMAFGPVTPNRTLTVGSNPAIFANDLDIAIDSGGCSNYLANKLLDHVFKGTAFTQPTTIRVGAWGATLVDASTGATAGESASGGYARVNIDDGWDEAAGQVTANTAAITFPTATASWAAQVTYYGVVDNDSVGAGNMLFYGALDTPRTIGEGDVFRFIAGALDVVLQ